ncbi:MAG: hypothetical protein AAGA80_06685 [Cyanobacteria bacterium P01_F01_bin.143]
MLHLIFCIFLWSTIGSFIIWKLLKEAHQGVSYIRKMHQIPCSNCIYFTGNYRLKCTVDPIKALTEDAIACRDFETKSYYSINEVIINK